MIELIGLDEIEKTFNKIDTEVIKRKSSLNMKRARNFTKYTKGLVGGGNSGIKKNKPATRKIQVESHPPEYWKGVLLSQIEEKILKLGAAGSGYFSTNTKKPESRHLPFKSRRPITWTKIAILQHAGYRIPLAGDKGKRVRAFLAHHGIFMKKTKTHIQVSPRPFLFNSATRFNKKGDVNTVNKYMNQLWSAL
jgi:hypothetical protein